MVGNSEMAENVIGLKDMKTGEQVRGDGGGGFCKALDESAPLTNQTI